MAEPTIIDVLELAYDFESEESAWLERLAATTARVMKAPLGAFAYAFTAPDEGGVIAGDRVFATDIDADRLLTQMYARATPAVEHHMFRAGVACGTLDDVVSGTGAPPIMRKVGRAMWRDVASIGELFVITAKGRGGRRVHLNFPYRQSLGPSTKATLARWGVCSAHIGAALRLRDAGAHVEADAIFSPDGRCLHADGLARAGTAAAGLRRAVVARERARSRRGRGDPDLALRVWQGLVDGTWSLVDRFDADGRRLVVAQRNPIGERDPRRLTASEVRVAQLLVRGLSTKVMADRLGVSNARIGALVSSVVHKTRSANRADLIGVLRGLGVDELSG